MLGIAIQVIIFLLGLITLLVILVIGIRRHSTSWMLASSIGLILMIVSVWMGNWKIYQCKFTIPDKIDVFGHVRGNSNSYLNGYWVLLYEENVETANYITQKGKFAGDKKDKENDGYFVFEIPNTYQLTRCSMATDFKQDSFGHNYLWFKNKTTYIWHNFNDLRPGTHFQITLDEQKKKYTLLVLPRSAGDYPNELNTYHTYLDPTGNAAINIPIKTYIMAGDAAIETVTGYFVEAHPLSNAIPGAPTPVLSEVRDAWVEDDSTNPVTPKTDPNMAGEEIIDIDNCTGSTSINKTDTRSKVYMHEVQFQGNPPYDLGQVAVKAAPSLGFVQGQIDIADAVLSLSVPARTHMKYKIVWHDLWKTGNMRVDLGESNISLHFRERIGLTWTLESYRVDCP